MDLNEWIGLSIIPRTGELIRLEDWYEVNDVVHVIHREPPDGIHYVFVKVQLTSDPGHIPIPKNRRQQ